MSADSTHKNISETAYTGGPTLDGIATIIAASDQRLTDIEVLIADRVKGDATSMANWFERRLLAAPDAVVVIEADREWSYRELWAAAVVAVQIGFKHGLEAGDAVALMAPRSRFVVNSQTRAARV